MNRCANRPPRDSSRVYRRALFALRRDTLACLLDRIAERQQISHRIRVRNELVKRLRPDNADVVFDYTVVDRYLADEVDALVAHHHVDDWAPALSLRLCHGRDEATVPFAAGEDALAAMRARGAADVTLTVCTAVPASHLGCVSEFLQFVLAEFARHARDL